MFVHTKVMCVKSLGLLLSSTSIIFIYFFQEKDLKSYMDDCGGIISLNNVKVSLFYFRNK